MTATTETKCVSCHENPVDPESHEAELCTECLAGEKDDDENKEK